MNEIYIYCNRYFEPLYKYIDSVDPVYVEVGRDMKTGVRIVLIPKEKRARGRMNNFHKKAAREMKTGEAK